MAISVENLKFFPPHVLKPPLKGFPLELGADARSEITRIKGITRPSNKFLILEKFSPLDTLPACDRRTDGQTDTARQQRPRLQSIARVKIKIT